MKVINLQNRFSLWYLTHHPSLLLEGILICHMKKIREKDNQKNEWKQITKFADGKSNRLNGW